MLFEDNRVLYPGRLIGRAVLAVTALLTLAGCEAAGYYGQAVRGHLALQGAQRPIKKLIVSPDTPSELKARLETVLKIREFAEKNLHLPVKKSYLNYVDLDRPYVVWIIYATPEFSMTPGTWCYLVVGCMVYRSYFSEESANAYAQGLTDEGDDVYVGGRDRLFHHWLVQRSGFEHVHAPDRCRTGGAHLPRTGASGSVRQKRFGL